MKRTFTLYEGAQLVKHKVTDFDLEKMGGELGEKFLHIPVEYITGFCEFRKNDFQVSRDTLIPRIETEEIIDLGFEFLEKNFKDKKKISFADIGTGSGIIGISFGNELSEKGIGFTGILSDISPNALAIAKQNADRILNEKNREDEKVVFLESNLFENFPSLNILNSEIKLDIVFANLPYIPSMNVLNLDTSVKDFEPSSALDGGIDGLDLIRKLLEQVPAFLDEKGVVILEVDDSHVDATEFLANWNVKIRKDSFGNNRFWILKAK